MSNCPQCQVQLEIDPAQYGTLYTCANCNKVFFISWEGEPEVSVSALENVPQEQTPEPVPEYVEPSETISDKENFQDVVDFGNSDNPALTYSIEIAEIDLISQEKILSEAFLDAKLGLDWNDLQKKIRNGVLQISNLSSVKAAVILQRLKSAPFKISWQQHLFQVEGKG